MNGNSVNAMLNAMPGNNINSGADIKESNTPRGNGHNCDYDIKQLIKSTTMGTVETVMTELNTLILP